MNYSRFERDKILSEILTEFEEKVGLECPGQDLALCWYRYLYYSNSVLQWIFDTETIRPTGLPPWIREGKFEDGIKEPMDRWRRYRKGYWERKYWTLDRSSLPDNRIFLQLNRDPDLLDEYRSKWLFGEVLTAIPLEIFQWAHSYMILMEKSEMIYHSYSDAMWELIHLPHISYSSTTGLGVGEEDGEPRIFHEFLFQIGQNISIEQSMVWKMGNFPHLMSTNLAIRVVEDFFSFGLAWVCVDVIFEDGQ
jgi:hypothetical protein